MFAIVHRVCHTVTTSESESGERRTGILKRHETCRNPIYIKAVRGHTALQNRRETRRNPKSTRDVPGF